MQMQLLQLALTISLWPEHINTGWMNGSHRRRWTGMQGGRTCLCEKTASKVNTESIPRAIATSVWEIHRIMEIALSHHEAWF